MKKITLLLGLLSLAVVSSNYAQTNRVLVSVNWPDKSYENKVEVYDPANNLLLSICNVDDCYDADGDLDQFNATYDLGCLVLDPITLPNYYVKLYNINDISWDDESSVTVNVAGDDVFTNDGNSASSIGAKYNFNVNSSTLCNYPDTDNDGVIDEVDIDDDNDGILDVEEGLGIDNYNCTVPTLEFENGVFESGIEGQVGAIYRFGNALEGYDILVEIVDIDNAELEQIDDDGQDTPSFLQTEIKFTGNGTPGIEFKFTLVDAGTSNPSDSIFRIGGTTWDVDGTEEYQESVRYYNPSAYGLDNPTSLTQDSYTDGAGVTSGNVTYAGFATNTTLRSYFQFLSNTFNIRMQLKKTTSTERTRLYAMSFTQCDILDYQAPQLTILSGNDTDGDGITNQLDLDSDNDGIPDNVEAQSTTGYIAPTGIIDIATGVDTAYPNGIVIVNTDDDNLFDYVDTDSDNDGTPDIEENGMADAIIVFTDDDNDGLDNIFETNGTIDLAFDVNEDIEVPATDLPDSDGDLNMGGDVDYRDGLDVFYSSASIDFDGEDDYMDSDLDLDGMTQATIMAWVKLDPDFDTSFIMNQGDFEVGLTANGTLFTSINGRTLSVPDTYDFDVNKWYHITVIFDSSLPSDNLKLYVSGEFAVTVSHPSLLNPIDVWTPDKFTIGKESGDDKKYFKGAIDEVRVFDIALTEGQIHQMVHQEITNFFGTVRGVVIPKQIIDFNTNATIPWSNLQAYYPMTDVLASKTFDLSSYNKVAKLYNITSVQPQTAPMPYTTSADGAWEQMSTWSNGDVWDISDDPITKPWSIIKVSHNMTANNDINSHGLIIDADKSITMTGDNAITNAWYLELNGTLDLQNDSQLVQGPSSDLITSATGKVLRRQEGNADKFWYNYWSSPVGTTGSTSLSDNNGSSNNTNNSPFNIDMLMDGTGNTAMQFTSAYDEVGKISDRWLYSFQNGLNYYDWVTLTPSSDILPGVGYTQKGTGNAGTQQQYTFVGKPNNGTILIPATDVPGDSGNESEQDVTLTTTLIGNPYPSAIDARKFISDNAGVIQGTILLWEQWAGTSHWLAEYEGGYGFINNLATERAYQYAGIPIADQVQTQGIKMPTYNLPVGQGFFVEVVNDGDIEFNNSQRVFIKESDADGVNPNNGSSFFRDGDSQTMASSTESRMDGMSILRLEFGVSNGASRSFVLGFSDYTTDGFDYGYDGGLVTNPPADDMGSILNGQQYVIQAFAPITPEKEVALIMHSSGSFTHTLKSTEITNIPESQSLFIRDNLTGSIYDLRSTEPYNFTSDAGTFMDRFEVVFTDPTLSVNDDILNTVVIFVDNNQDKLMVKGLDQDVKHMTLGNMLGQTVKAFNDIENNALENGVHIGDLSSGVYLVSLITEDNLKLNKKIILE